MTDQTIISAFKSNDQAVIKQLYQDFRPRFENWVKGKYKIGEAEDLHEIYQRSFTTLYLNAKRGKLDTISSSVETYLYGIGKLVVLEWNREQSRLIIDDRSEEEFDQLEFFHEAFGNSVDENLSQKLAKHLEQLGEPCKTILKLFYWERNSMEAIANKTGYKNERVARKKKYSCLQKLKERMLN